MIKPMNVFKKESLDLLRSRIDLVEVLKPHLDLKRMGASYKALCPFHEERTPSFVVKKGDGHYHCFGCGAHGDAIAFMMNHLRMSFTDAIEQLAETFNVRLEKEELKGEASKVNKRSLKDALEQVATFYHTSLLHTAEGHNALNYLYNRGITLDFIRTFRIGYALHAFDLFFRFIKSVGISEETAELCGLLRSSQSGGRRPFFSERITFPILDAMGSVIGFSARKIKEETFGGKYINTPETPLFKKSQVLFGLSFSRRRIAKERRALVVEGQIDALRLIHEGLDFVVAGQGTAFGEGHVAELLALGVNVVYLALDGDAAGQAAAVKIGDLFQKKGVEVLIVPIPQGMDPDTLLQEVGPQGFLELLKKCERYLPFLVAYHSRHIDPGSPSGKNELAAALSAQVRAWEAPVMVHESMHLLAELLKVPVHLLGTTEMEVPNIYLKRQESLAQNERFDPNKVMEADLVRWLLLVGQSRSDIVERIRRNISSADFKHEACKQIFELYLNLFEQGKERDLLSITSALGEGSGAALLSQILEKRVQMLRIDQGVDEAILKLLERDWMERREQLRARLQEGNLSDEQALELARAFDEMKKNPPVLYRT